MGKRARARERGQVNIRLSTELREAIAILAARERRKFSDMARLLLEDAIAEREAREINTSR